MEATKCLKPSDSGSRNGDRASVQAATRANAEHASKRSMCRPTRRPLPGKAGPAGDRATAAAAAIRANKAQADLAERGHCDNLTAPTRRSACGDPNTGRTTGSIPHYSRMGLRQPRRLLAHARRGVDTARGSLTSFFTLSKRKGLPHLSGSRPRDRRFHVQRNLRRYHLN
jgi:hypothetical protein